MKIIFSIKFSGQFLRISYSNLFKQNDKAGNVSEMSANLTSDILTT